VLAAKEMRVCSGHGARADAFASPTRYASAQGRRLFATKVLWARTLLACWGDARRFSDLDVLRRAASRFLGTEATELMGLVEEAVSRGTPNRHGHHAMRLPVQATFDERYCRRRMCNLLCPGLESRVCRCGQLLAYGREATVPERCRACRLPSDVRLATRPRPLSRTVACHRDLARSRS
jgi:hypothetical protein